MVNSKLMLGFVIKMIRVFVTAFGNLFMSFGQTFKSFIKTYNNKKNMKRFRSESECIDLKPRYFKASANKSFSSYISLLAIFLIVGILFAQAYFVR